MKGLLYKPKKKNKLCIGQCLNSIRGAFSIRCLRPFVLNDDARVFAPLKMNKLKVDRQAHPTG